MSDTKSIKYALKNLVTKSFWAGMWCSVTFTVATRAVVDTVLYGQPWTIWHTFIVSVNYAISLFEFLVYLGMHKKIDKQPEN